MEDSKKAGNNGNVISSLLERVEAFGKTNYDLLKLKTVDKTSDVISTIASRLIAIIIIFVCFLMFTIGIGFWLGKILDNTAFGFFAVALIYGIIGFLFYFFLHKRIKKFVGDFIVREVLK